MVFSYKHTSKHAALAAQIIAEKARRDFFLYEVLEYLRRCLLTP